MIKYVWKALLITSLYVATSTSVIAQGQDSTVAERDIMILGEIFPGTYDNANQAYFDVRLNVDKTNRHAPTNKQITRLEAKPFGDYVFWSEEKRHIEDEPSRFYLYAFSVDNERNAVRMKTYNLKKAPSKRLSKKQAKYIEGCDLLWRQEAGQFVGQLDGDSCGLTGKKSKYHMLLTDDSLWQTMSDSVDGEVTDYYKMDRARSFDCYVDVPGVGGGVDVPFKRYHLKDIPDLGGEKWVTVDDGTEIGISLFRAMWPMNNYSDAFARPSFVIYAKTKDEDDKAQTVAYSFTSPEVQRLGINLKWALLNCHMIPRQDVLPFYKTDEPRI